MSKNLMDYFTKKEKEKIELFEKDIDLIDNCKYMLYIKDEYAIDYHSLPCKSIKEAKQFIKDYTN